MSIADGDTEGQQKGKSCAAASQASVQHHYPGKLQSPTVHFFCSFSALEQTFVAWCISHCRILTLIRDCVHSIQEGWLSLTERASVSAHFGLSWVRLWDNRVNVTWMERFKDDSMLFKRIAARTHLYLQPFPSNSIRKFKSSPF